MAAMERRESTAGAPPCARRRFAAHCGRVRGERLEVRASQRGMGVSPMRGEGILPSHLCSRRSGRARVRWPPARRQAGLGHAHQHLRWHERSVFDRPGVYAGFVAADKAAARADDAGMCRYLVEGEMSQRPAGPKANPQPRHRAIPPSIACRPNIDVRRSGGWLLGGRRSGGSRRRLEDCRPFGPVRMKDAQPTAFCSNWRQTAVQHSPLALSVLETTLSSCHLTKSVSFVFSFLRTVFCFARRVMPTGPRW
jgi:hypothetical protein